MYNMEIVGKTPSYYKKKNKENYQKNKRLSKDYQIEKIVGESFTKYKQRIKKLK